MGERSARRLRAEDFALLMRDAVSPASNRTYALDSAVSVVDSFAQCFVAQDSLDSGGSVMPVGWCTDVPIDSRQLCGVRDMICGWCVHLEMYGRTVWLQSTVQQRWS